MNLQNIELVVVDSQNVIYDGSVGLILLSIMQKTRSDILSFEHNNQIIEIKFSDIICTIDTANYVISFDLCGVVQEYPYGPLLLNRDVIQKDLIDIKQKYSDCVNKQLLSKHEDSIKNILKIFDSWDEINNLRKSNGVFEYKKITTYQDFVVASRMLRVELSEFDMDIAYQIIEGNTYFLQMIGYKSVFKSLTKRD